MLNLKKTQKRNLNLNQHANLRTVHMCVCEYNCAQLAYTIQHRTVLIIFYSNLQTIITAQMLSIGRERKMTLHDTAKVVHKSNFKQTCLSSGLEGSLR